VPLHQRIEEMPQRRECLVLGRRGTLDLADVFAGDARRDLAKFKPALIAPVQKATDNSTIRASRVFVADAGPEEFVGGEGSVRGSMQDGAGRGRNGQERFLRACGNQCVLSVRLRDGFWPALLG
jgi:hypothetical protein